MSESRPAVARQRARHRARQAAVQMLYQWEIGRQDVEQVLATFWSSSLPGAQELPEGGRAFADQLVRSTIENVARIDGLIGETAEHWRLSRMAALDRLILRMAIGEFLQGATPRNVVINEAL